MFLLIFLGLFLIGCGGGKKVVQRREDKPQKIEAIPNLPAVIEDIEENNNDNTPVKRLYNDLVSHYINTYAPIAMDEMREHKIPASITLAQAILESGAGEGELTRKANNHFGIKCHDWKGAVVYHDDDAKGECFRKYKDPAQSFEDHSLFLTGRRYYTSLFLLDIADYKSWAWGLKKAGYATDPKYPNKLIGLIEKYKLYRYDQQVLGSSNEEHQVALEEMGEEPTYKVVHTVGAHETLYGIAKKYQVTIDAILQINGLDTNAITINQQLIIPLKSRMDNEENSVIHIVLVGETLYSIAKKYNVSLEAIKQANNLDSNVISIGQRLVISK